MSLDEGALKSEGQGEHRARSLCSQGPTHGAVSDSGHNASALRLAPAAGDKATLG